MNSIVNNDRMTKVISVVLTVVFGVLLISLVANATSTISTNIETGGTLSVTGASTLTGLTSMIQASSTRFSVHDKLYVGGTATTTIGSDGTLTVPVGKTTTLTTSNSATSTLIAGCVQMYATSTVTAVHLTFATANMATTSSQSGTGGDAATGLATGVVLWKYGACPI